MTLTHFFELNLYWLWLWRDCSVKKSWFTKLLIKFEYSNQTLKHWM